MKKLDVFVYDTVSKNYLFNHLLTTLHGLMESQ